MLRKGRKEKRETTLFAADTTVRGSVRFSGRVYVSGRVEGDVGADDDSDAMLIVSAGGRVVGDVRAPFVSVSGTIEGNVHCQECVEVAATGTILGNVRYQRMEMMPGAAVIGELQRIDESQDNVHKLTPVGDAAKDVTAS